MKKDEIRFEKYAGPEDFHYYSSLVYDECVMKMNMGRVFTTEEAKEYFAYMMESNQKYEFGGNFKVFSKNTKEYIGTATLRINNELTGAEVEYMLLPDFWGNGYGTKIVAELINFATNYESVKEISAITVSSNIRSINILIKNGFEFHKRFKVEENNNYAEVFSKKL